MKLKPGPNEHESCWELTLTRVSFNSQRLTRARAKREKTLDDSQETFEQVQIRWERTRNDESYQERMRVSGQTRARVWTLDNSHSRLTKAYDFESHYQVDVFTAQFPDWVCSRYSYPTVIVRFTTVTLQSLSSLERRWGKRKEGYYKPEDISWLMDLYNRGWEGAY